MRQETDYPGYRRIVRDSFEHWYQAGKDSWTGAPTNDKVTDFSTANAPLPVHGTRRVLDVGCGRGHQTVQLAERLDADVVGLDLLDVWDARRPAHGTARFRQGDFLSFAEGPVDLLVDNGCLHHQRREEWPGWVEHGRALLRPGGVWVVSCFLSPTAEVVAKPLADGRLNWWLTESAVTELFARSGLTATQRTVIDRQFNYQGHWLKYLALAFVRS
ncbi:class I SAM-dependent methyltransferase [Streptomyces silvisoli]|uniref:Class I SAM-dependent methyltransferase n=1 Tax=Streptomyces silvisoli TaxID=3034235 RepID=A0ABT5ZKW5_9ACTN|nr:class I SAM-dependent methyltransferase [Streptomyces silvisoli]MDF3290477.1 class I SAM-dependent methyltransferase [Streptomyces silvisoli]